MRNRKTHATMAAMQLPEHYWHDVNRHTEEILSDLPLQDDPYGTFIVRIKNRVYQWPGKEHAAAYLLQTVPHLLGIAATTSYALALQTAPDSPASFIKFDPKKNQIVGLRDEILTPENPAEHPFLFGKSMWTHWRFSRKVGTRTVTDHHYTLLSEELARGAAFRRFEV